LIWFTLFFSFFQITFIILLFAMLLHGLLLIKNLYWA
jgi:hypothetical protein